MLSFSAFINSKYVSYTEFLSSTVGLGVNMLQKATTSKRGILEYPFQEFIGLVLCGIPC